MGVVILCLINIEYLRYTSYKMLKSTFICYKISTNRTVKLSCVDYWENKINRLYKYHIEKNIVNSVKNKDY